MEKGMTVEESLRLTYDSNYPDAFEQLSQIFRSDRTGDVIVTSKKGADLRYKFEHPLHKSGHGALSKEHMQVPLLCNHPIERDHIRSVDVMPTILKLTGKPDAVEIDGRSLV